MEITTRMAKPGDLERLGAIAAVSFFEKTRASFGRDKTKTASIFADFLRTGFFPMDHTIVAELDNKIVGFTTLKFEAKKPTLREFYKIFRTHLGFFGGLRALLILPWLTGETFDDKTQMYLEFIAVDPGYRDMGVGSRLIAETHRYGIASGRKEACGYVVYQNHQAKELYKRMGMNVEPPTFRLWWLSKTLYHFSGYHRIIWPLRPQARQEQSEENEAAS